MIFWRLKNDNDIVIVKKQVLCINQTENVMYILLRFGLSCPCFVLECSNVKKKERELWKYPFEFYVTLGLSKSLLNTSTQKSSKEPGKVDTILPSQIYDKVVLRSSTVQTGLMKYSFNSKEGAEGGKYLENIVLGHWLHARPYIIYWINCIHLCLQQIPIHVYVNLNKHLTEVKMWAKMSYCINKNVLFIKYAAVVPNLSLFFGLKHIKM